ncbi:hypothetical protein JK359_15765 [Streptomyces actinomycinicus]|uniref:Lipoprotein n=1 Tax=Streptomyces actinomycinicus TaxID=1695166 RepID=A0A937EJA5_9ACTN|nr:hypothetical protein [Streptomyces actinomycinicus]
MRPLYVPVRLAVAALAVTAAAGCVNVGDDAGRARPVHSAGQRGGEAPDGGPVAGVGDLGHEEAAADGKHGHGRKKKPGKPVSASARPSRAGSASAVPAKPGRTEKPGEPEPSAVPPTPPASTPPPEPPASTPPPVSEPPSAEPSSSAHEETEPQLVQREPAPAAGVAV